VLEVSEGCVAESADEVFEDDPDDSQELFTGIRQGGSVIRNHFGAFRLGDLFFF